MRRLCLAALLLVPSLTSAQSVDAPYGMQVSDSELRFVFGVHSLGVDLELGRRGPADHARAVQAYRKAAVLGFPLSQNNLGRLYETGRGVPRDPVIAHMWYTMAAKGGDALLRADRDRSARRLIAEELSRAKALAEDLQRHLPDPRHGNDR